MATLEQVHRGDPANPAIVFVHGLSGDMFDTWVGPGTSRDDFWLNWVGQDTGCDIWTVGYDAALSRWKDQALPLPDQGTQVGHLLAVHSGLKDRTVVLVGHSMGGLVIKTLITQAQAAGDVHTRALLGRICGVVFLATPHQGSQLANLAAAVAVLLRTNEQVGDMKLHDARIRQLGIEFREQRRVLHLKVAAFAEGRDCTLRKKGFLGVLIRQVGVRIVDPSSSDPALEGVTAVSLAEDHFSICKPSSRDAQVHHAMVAFVKEEILSKSPTAPAAAQERSEVGKVSAPLLTPPLTAVSAAGQYSDLPAGLLVNSMGSARSALDNYPHLLSVFEDAPRLRAAAVEVIESNDYPRLMSVGDRLVPNPVWDKTNVDRIPETVHLSDRLRGHMLLAVVEPLGGRPHLYCYRSDRWSAFLIPFVKHEPEVGESGLASSFLDRVVAQRYSSRAVPTNKIVVSVKRNEEHPEETWLYAFEFYNLVLPPDFALPSNHSWLDLERLSDPRHREAAVNGDVVRAIRSHFGTGLHGLVRSPDALARASLGDS